jgi:hypothetical protein
MIAAAHRVLPGFRLSLGFTMTYLSLLVFIPLAACFAKAGSIPPDEFLAAVWSPRAQSAYGLTVGASLAAALASVPLGVLVAWVLVRYSFPGKRFLDALVDLPFALPTAVAGLVYSSLYVEKGWLGQFLVPLGIHGAYSRFAIVLVLLFIGLPFVVRTVQPILEDFDAEMEEAAASRGYAAADVPARDRADPAAGRRHRICPRVRARARRVRIGRFRFGQHPVQDRNRPRSHRRRTGEFQLRGGCRDRRRSDDDLAVDAGADQSSGTLEQIR